MSDRYYEENNDLKKDIDELRIKNREQNYELSQSVKVYYTIITVCSIITYL